MSRGGLQPFKDYTGREINTLPEQVRDCPEFPAAPAPIDEQCNDLHCVAVRAADRLAFLDRMRCPTPAAHDPLDYMRGSGLPNQLKGGVIWSSPDLDWRTLQPSLDASYAVLDQVGPCAIIHGDANLRNILCQDRDAHLIDFASCGPGHPAVRVILRWIWCG